MGGGGHLKKKNIGERNDCNNYRDNSILSIVDKLFDRATLIRFQKLAERVYPESRYGKRAAIASDPILSHRIGLFSVKRRCYSPANNNQMKIDIRM